MREFYFYDWRSISTRFFENLNVINYQVACDGGDIDRFHTENPAVLFIHRKKQKVSDECLLGLIRNNPNLNIVLYSTDRHSIVVPNGGDGRIHKVGYDYPHENCKKAITKFIAENP